MAIFFTIFFTIYGAINYYIFIRGWQAISAFPHLKIIYIILFVLASTSYLLAKFLEKYLSMFLYDSLMWIGSFWFSFMMYFLMAIILIDLARIVNWKFDVFPAVINNNYELAKQITFSIVFAIALIVNIAGFINTRNFKIRTLNIDLPKKESKIKSLNAVLISDVHLSPVNNKKFLSSIVKKINDINPDLIFIAGDLVDDKAEILKERNIGPALKKLNPKYGIYACTGNHEYINGAEAAVNYMRENNITVLRDTSIKIADSFFILSREDRSKKQFTGKERKPLSEIISEVDKIFPLILLDHTPFGLDDAKTNGIDLQLSGHTHHGQIFPANLITKMLYEVSWGYLKKDNTNYYVSCGVGTWGPPVRLGSNSEIVNLKLNFVD